MLEFVFAIAMVVELSLALLVDFCVEFINVQAFAVEFVKTLA